MVVMQLAGFAASPLHAQSPQAKAAHRAGGAKVVHRAGASAESKRLNDLRFRRGLRKRGLTELLDLHLRDYPPSGAIETLTMMRDLKLTEFADPTRTLQQRRVAIEEANELLRQMIDLGVSSPERFAWRFSLARSLIYDQAEPFFTDILYFGGSQADFRSAVQYTQQAVETLASLSLQLKKEYDRVEQLPVDAFERLERTGYVKAIDALEPKVRYVQLWALFYDAISRRDDDPIRIDRLNQVQEIIAKQATLIDTPHAESKVQVQALTLAGMTHRRLNRHAAARHLFDLALIVADRLTDAGARKKVQWAIDLAQLEQIRNERDDRRYERSYKKIARLRNLLRDDASNSFGMSLSLALTERSVYRAQAASLRGKMPTKAQELVTLGWHALYDLTGRQPARKDQIYAKVVELIPSSAPSSALDPFDQVAQIAGLLARAEESKEHRGESLGQAITQATVFLDHRAATAPEFVPEVRYNRAVAHYKLGHIDRAIQDFIAVATQHPTFEHALQAAKYAADLAADIYNDPKLNEEPRVQQLFHDAASAVVDTFPDTDEAAHWRFYLAQVLERMGRFQEAADQYVQVASTHEHYLDARFAQIRCLAHVLRGFTNSPEHDLFDLRRRADRFFELSREFVSHVPSRSEVVAGLSQRNEPSDVAKPLDAAEHSEAAKPSKELSVAAVYAARVKVLTAEVQSLPPMNRPAQALQTLEDFEKDYASLGYLLGRVWRVRLLAYEQLGRLDDAAKAIPAYLAADTEHAGPTLQTLYVAMADQAGRLQAKGETRSAMNKAQVALLLAKQIVRWATDRQDQAGAPLSALTIQLAQAHLRVGEAATARVLLEPMIQSAAKRSTPGQSVGIKLEMAYAESLFQLNKFGEALPHFNKLATRLPDKDQRRWKALLRDLQCRTGLREPAGDIVKVIQQQMFLYPDMDRSPFAEAFERLLRENQRRAAN